MVAKKKRPAKVQFKARDVAKVDRNALFLAVDELTSALRDWLNEHMSFLDESHDFSRGDMLASGIVALLPLLEDAERRTGAKVESFNSVLLERELRAREEG